MVDWETHPVLLRVHSVNFLSASRLSKKAVTEPNYPTIYPI